MMKELRTFINEFPSDKPIETIITFFVDNNWFNEDLFFIDNKIMLNDRQLTLFAEKLTFFLTKDMNDLYAAFRIQYPKTWLLFLKFLSETKTDDRSKYYIVDFLLLRLKKELPFYNDTEMDKLVSMATLEMIKAHGDILTFFISWVRVNARTTYQKDYLMQKRYTMDLQNTAYSFDEYLQLFYYLFVDEYIEDNDMFVKAAESKNYTDTWLYLSLYLIRPLRLTDAQRIYHPDLPYSPEETIEKIKNGTFTDNDARHVLLSITDRMCWLPLTPNKTSETRDVVPIVFDIPPNCDAMLGKLFALAQAHRDIAGESDAPIIRKISTYQDITRYMGDEIGDLFLYNDFRSKSATKSFLQTLNMIADEDIPPEISGFQLKGYFLASLARNHKGSYGEFARTTFTYLKDAKLNQLTPEFVAFELLERGVFSFMASMLLKMALGEDFNNLSPHNQTAVIKLIDLSPREIESVVSIVDRGRLQAQNILTSLINEDDNILEILHQIGSGQAVSKQRECLCLMHAMKRECPYKEQFNCVTCEYEISVRSTMFLLIKEYNRNRLLYSATQDPLEKAKYKSILLTVVAPKMDEMLATIKELGGEKMFEDYEDLIKENTVCQ